MNKLTNKLTIFGIFLFGILLINSINAVSAASDFVNLGEYDVEYTYDKAVAGDRFNLIVTITNLDNENKTDVMFEFNEEDPFEFIEEDDWNIGNLSAKENVSKTFRIEIDESADSSDYELEFSLEDDDEDYDDVLEIEVKSDNAELVVWNLQSEPKTILPDMKDIKLTVEIENRGDVDAEYIKAKLILPPGFVPSSSYSDVYNLGTIQSGVTKQAVFYIDTEKTLNSNLYEAKIQLDYENSGDEKSEELGIDLPVQGIPQFSISGVATNPSKIKQGDSVVLKFDVNNIGEKEAKETSIKIFEKSDQPFNFEEKTYFVGTIEPGKSGASVFKFDVDSGATPTNYLLDIQIRSVYNEEVIISEETISITVHEKEGFVTSLTGAIIGENNNATFLFIITIFLVLISLILVVSLRFKRKK